MCLESRVSCLSPSPSPSPSPDSDFELSHRETQTPSSILRCHCSFREITGNQTQQHCNLARNQRIVGQSCTQWFHYSTTQHKVEVHNCEPWSDGYIEFGVNRRGGKIGAQTVLKPALRVAMTSMMILLPKKSGEDGSPHVKSLSLLQAQARLDLPHRLPQTEPRPKHVLSVLCTHP
eukprot:2265537-Rhodomonas_salina.1